MVYNLWGILQIEIAYVTISLFVAAGLAWVLFRKLGYGLTGGLVASGLFVLSLGFVFVSLGGIMIYPSTIEIAPIIAIVGRTLQAIGSTFLMIGFYRYYRLS